MRAAIVRQLSAEDLRALDSNTTFGAVLSVNLEGLYSQSQERRCQAGQQPAPLSPARTHDLIFSLSEKKTLATALERISSSASRKQLKMTPVDSKIFTHTSRRPSFPSKVKCPVGAAASHPNFSVDTPSAEPTPEQSSTLTPMMTEEADMTT
ncbi:unnamed protein product, partial [Dibothriocephalus latus]